MDTILTFFITYTKRIYAAFLKSKTIHNAELLIPLRPPNASGGQEEEGSSRAAEVREDSLMVGRVWCWGLI